MIHMLVIRLLETTKQIPRALEMYTYISTWPIDFNQSHICISPMIPVPHEQTALETEGLSKPLFIVSIYIQKEILYTCRALIISIVCSEPFYSTQNQMFK